MQMPWEFAIPQLTVCLRLVDSAGKVICSKHPAVISICYILFCAALCATCSLLRIFLPFVRRILCRLIWPQSGSKIFPLLCSQHHCACHWCICLHWYLKIPPSLPFKNLIPIDLVTHIHINTIPSLSSVLCSFYRWSFPVFTSWFPLAYISLCL